MVNQKRLDWFRREISRFTTNEDEAWEFVLELLVTDWKEVAELDYQTRKQNCECCGRPVLRRLIIDVEERLPGWRELHKRRVCSECESDVKKGYRVKCAGCKQKFISHSYFYYIGEGCSSALLQQECPECDKAHRHQIRMEVGSPKNTKCVGCHVDHAGQYTAGISMCLSCRETYNIDDRKIRIEYQKVNAHILRAEALNLPATLTLDEWFSRLIDAKFLCQYCLASPYEHADHFIPLCKGGGTVLDNMVPACENCNKLKGQRHPDKVTSIPRESLNRVRGYLDQFSESSKNCSENALKDLTIST